MVSQYVFVGNLVIIQIPIDADVSTGFDYQYEISYATYNANGYISICMTTYDDETYRGNAD